jgi:hypothetical protein
MSLEEKITGFSFSYAKKTGIMKGKCKLIFEDGSVSASYAGVLTLGWFDCGCEEDNDTLIPLEGGTYLGLGSVWFKDTVNGKKVTRSISFGVGL